MNKIKPLDSYWTDDQWNAIAKNDENILVSAGAGSGKTAVLTQRIIEKLKDGIHLRNLVVLTFTKAAALEMKERIREGIIKEIEKAGNIVLKEELDFIDQANIQTFDGYALSLVRKYHYIISVNKSISIGDDVVFLMKKNEIINTIFNNKYVSKDKSFIKLVKYFCIKNDDNLKKAILNIIKKIELLVDDSDYLDHFEKYLQRDFIEIQIKKYLDLLIEFKNKIEKKFYSLYKYTNDETLIEHLDSCKVQLNSLFAANNYKDFVNLPVLAFPTITRKQIDGKEFIKDGKDEVKKKYAKLLEFCNYDSEDEMIREILYTKDYIEEIVNIVKEYKKMFNEYEKINNVYDFSGIAKLAIRLVKENDEIRKNISDSINEILIDEYQDTNDIQETLISLIAKDNVYMVGDVKQSIYRFRNANPKIFSEKYSSYKTNNKKGLVIDLSKNFRSRNEVIKSINNVFERVMSYEIGGANYNDGHRLVFGNEKYNKTKYEDNDLLIYSYTRGDNCSYNKDEIEAIIIANDINKRIKDQYKVFDNTIVENDISKRVRRVTYKDFAIITNDKKKFDLYKKILEFYEIPVVINKDESFISSLEIVVIKNILKAGYCLIDNDYYKSEFKFNVVSILRSFIIKANDEEISRLFIGDFEKQLKLLFNDVYDKLLSLAVVMKNNSLIEVLDYLLKKFDIYESLIHLKDPIEAEDRINFLVTKAVDLTASGLDYIEFIKYIDFICSDKDLDIGYETTKSQDQDAVCIINTHKSKGLEYNICYYCELSKEFYFPEMKERIIFDKDFGLIIPAYDEGFVDTIYKKVLKNDNLKEDISEKIRLFYVALTRAKDKIIFVLESLDENKDNTYEPIENIDKMNYKSNFDILNSIRNTLNAYTNNIVFVDPTDDYRLSDKKKSLGNMVSSKVIQYEKVELLSETKKIDKASTQRYNILTKETSNIMEFGSILHKYFEIIDIYNLNEFDLSSIDQNILNKVNKFINCGLFKGKIINIFHEYAFSYYVNKLQINGVIDLIIEKEEEFIIVDYKLSDTSHDEYKEQIKVYYNYIQSLGLNKRIDCYLYSINKDELRKI